MSESPDNRVLVESSPDTPLVWLSVAGLTGCSADPIGAEGFYRHAFELARRGTSDRDRKTIDEELDAIGASLDPFVARDYAGFSGLCMRDDLDRLLAVACDILGNAAFSEDEHQRLVRESLHGLDELRDDDSDVAARFFNREVAPGYPYSRTSIGTERSLRSLAAADCQRAYRAASSADHQVIGLAGDIDEVSARRAAERLRAAATAGADHPAVDLEPPSAAGRRIVVVHKPKRTQSQILLGHLGPRYGTPDYLALLPVETCFGGMFTSRMMQEIRVKRGWSYGAYCRLGKARGQHWLRMSMAPSLDQSVPAIELLVEMYRELASAGIDAEELEFSSRYLAGQTAFQLATSRRRLSADMEPALYGSPAGFARSLPDRLRTLDHDTVQDAAQRWIRPDELCIVVVTDADVLAEPLRELGLGPVEVVD
ncbi:MAG: insulinase family protein, partial [Deltaproteobacteria bacterium]|nr:insulinase family protein [Deltaproteobacteria bacterium]